ncbi:MAG: hypothetical protein M3Q75_01350 [Gemmatimonadota bacterium]|nr:hypothetical protein [Gemmatimonadota bacterium]
MTDRTAEAIGATFTAFMPDQGRRDLSPEELDSMNDILDAAAEWAAGRLPLNAAAQVGTILTHQGHPSRAYSRHVASLWAWRAKDSRWKSLNRMVNVLAAAVYVKTSQGLFTSEQLHEHDRAVQYLRDHPSKEAA